MSLRINHNLAALNANRNLAQTTNMVSKSMQKLSSGFRINAAADDPAGLVISEQFRSQIAGLNRAVQNSEGSISMVQTAEGALTEINNLLISMRELAIHAANEGFNDVDQLAADQAEISNALKTIDRVASQTQFGTKKILDGTRDNNATITSAGTSGLTIKQSNLATGTHSITATKTADPTSTLNTTSLGLSLNSTTGTPYNLTEKIHNVDVVQASDVAKKTSGSINLADAWGNGMTLAATATSGMVSSSGAIAAVIASGSGNYTFTLNYQENGESPTGNQTLTINAIIGDTTATIASKLQTQINLNSALAGKVIATGTAAGILRIKTANQGAQYSLRAEATSTTATTGAFDVAAGSTRGSSANLLNFTIVTDKYTSRTANATVAAATYTDFTTLTTALNNALMTTGGTGGFGTVGVGIGGVIATLVNTNQIQFSTQDEGSAYSIKLNAGVAGTGNLVNVMKMTADSQAISGTDALVNLDNYTNNITKVKYANNTANTQTLYNKAVGAAGRGSITFDVNTAANGVKVGNLLLDVKAARFNVSVDGGPAQNIAAGVNNTVFNADRTQSMIVNYGLTSQGGTETITDTDQSLVFQIGANVGQTAAIAIRNMAASSLGKNLAGNMYASLAKIDVTTVAGAQDSQSIIDAAINEVSTTRGTLGSFQKNTLESNLRNLQIASQNLTASESQIRDTDIAAEMSEFTKNQILVQAGTAMLAQANQMPQVVLSLFK